MRVSSIAALFLCAWAVQAPAQATAGDCGLSSSPDIRVSACSQPLKTSRSARIRERAHNNRGLAYLALGRSAEAVADFNEVIRLNPRIAGYYDNRQNALRSMGRLAEALTDANTAIRLAPTFAFVFRARGNVLDQMKNYRAAEDDYARALEIDPDDAGLYVDRGRILGHDGKVPEATSSFSKALALNPTDAAALRERGLLYSANGEAGLARSDFDAALKLKPDDPVTLQAVSALPSLPAPFASSGKFSPDTSATSITADEKRIALVIGNSVYVNAPLLPNPRNDAAHIADALKRVGFSTEVRLDLTREQLLNAFSGFEEASETADWALIYYAGHGLEIAGTNYLVPTDAKLATDRSVALEAVTLDQAIHAASGARKLRLIVLDACRENPFANRIRLSAASRGVARGLGRPPDEDPGTLVVYAAKDGEVARDGDEGSGNPFASAFVEEMRRPGIEIRRMFDLISDDVLDRTDHQQQPLTYGRLPGREDFFFNRGS